MTHPVPQSILDIIALYTGKTSSLYHAIEKELHVFFQLQYSENEKRKLMNTLVISNHILSIISKHINSKSMIYSYIHEDIDALLAQNQEISIPLAEDFQFESLSEREKAIFMAGLEEGRRIEKT